MRTDDLEVNCSNEYDNQTFEHHLLQNEDCSNSCEMDNPEVGWMRYVLESILTPSVGVIGILGNLVSIMVFALSYDKTTFKHVRAAERSFIIYLLLI